MNDLVTSVNINSLGLLLDLVGVICVAISFKNIRREKDSPGLFAGDDEYQSKQEKEHKLLICLDRFGMLLLVVGFGLQIISNYMS